VNSVGLNEREVTGWERYQSFDFNKSLYTHGASSDCDEI